MSSSMASQRLTAEELQAIFDNSPFIAFANAKVCKIDHEKCELTISVPIRPEFERRRGSSQFHGGPIASIIDIAGDFAIGMTIGGGVPTINLRVDYLRPAKTQSLTAIARVRRSGKTVAIVDIDVMDDARLLVAIGRGCYRMLTS